MTLLPARDLQHLRIQNMQLILRIFQRLTQNHDFCGYLSGVISFTTKYFLYFKRF